VKGLELARRLGKPSQFLPEVKVLLEENGNYASIRSAVVDVFGGDADSESLAKFREFLDSDRVALKTTALEVLTANQDSIATSKLRELLSDESQKVRLLAALAVKMSDQVPDAKIEKLTQEVWKSPWKKRLPFPLPESLQKQAIAIFCIC